MNPSFRLLLVTTLLLTPLAAHAQDAQVGSTADEAARLTFLSAREAFAAGDYETALQRFQQAYELSQRPGLLYNIAQTYDRLRRDRETVAALRRYLQAAPDAENRAEVEARIRVLDASLAANPGTTTPSTSTGGGNPLAILHPALFISAAGVALVAGGLSIWTGLETVSLNDEYVASTSLQEAEDLYNQANGYQLGTNILLFSAGAFAVAAVVFAIITDWGALTGETAAGTVRPSFAATPGGGELGLRGWF